MPFSITYLIIDGVRASEEQLSSRLIITRRHPIKVISTRTRLQFIGP